nr:PREDICTED: bromodomain-containing protein 8 isoform X2 [Bemisia tabaci]
MKTNFITMTSTQERQVQRRWYVDEWSTREKLCLASAVLRSGDQNWNAVSRTIKPNAEGSRPLDWMVPKACANQYKLLLDSVETPKRKKRVAGEKLVESSETAAEYLVRKLTQDHQEDLKKRIELEKKEYHKIKSDIEAVESGSLTEEDLDKLVIEMDLEDDRVRQKEEECKRFLIEREQKKRDYERPLWKSPSVAAAQAAALKSTLSDKKNESGSISEILPETKPASTPTSPLLTSLLQSPSPLQRSSLSSTPTISNLLNSAPAIPHYSNDSPTLTQLLESKTSPRSASTSLMDNSLAARTDVHQKLSSPSSSMGQQIPDPPTQLSSSPRLSKSPVRPTPPKSDVLTTPVRVESNPDISNVVRCLYLEDKTCVDIEHTQLLLNQANVDLSKVDEQKLQDEIVDMIVEQQETGGINISNLNNSAITSCDGLPAVVKVEVPDGESSVKLSSDSKASDSNIVILECDMRKPVMDNSKECNHTQFNVEKTQDIKIEPDIPVEIDGSSYGSRNLSNASQFTEGQTFHTMPTVIDVEATLDLPTSQAEISVVGISPIKSELSLNEPSPKGPIGDNEKVSSHLEQPKSIPNASPKVTLAVPCMNIQRAAISPPGGKDSNTPLKGAKSNFATCKEDESGGVLSQNVLILDTQIDLSSASLSNDIMIDNDTEVIIAKDDSLKSGIKSDEQTFESKIAIKEEDDGESAPKNGKDKPDSVIFQKSLKYVAMEETVGSKSTSSDACPQTVSKKLSKSEVGVRLGKSWSEKSGSVIKGVVQSKRMHSKLSERKGIDSAIDEKESVKKIIFDEDEVTHDGDGDDEEDSDELLSNVKKTVAGSDKKNSGGRKKLSTIAVSSIPIVTDFVDTSSDTHSTGGDDSESTSTLISIASCVNKKSSAREKRDSITSATSSSSHVTAHEEKGIRAWKKSIMLSYNGIAAHKYASLFLKPITEDQAPGYHNIVKHPIDLLTIKKNIENGTIRTTLEFQRAIMLMFTNALFFNWHGSEVYKMTFEMMQETLGSIQLLVQTMGEGMPYAQSDAETPEKQVRAERIKRSAATPATPSVATPIGMKRKRSGLESSTAMNSIDQIVTPTSKRRR